MKISNFDQARRRLDELTSAINEIRQFLDVADRTISAVNVLKGTHAANPPLVVVRTLSMPKTGIDRVYQIFKEVAKPMMPKQVLELYEQKDWPRPENRQEFYTMISGCISYLTKRKKVLIKTDEGYGLKDPQD